MSSPLYSRIKIDRLSKEPVYLQIAKQLVSLIEKNEIEVGTKLPGTRAFADLLEVHRKTMVAAYEELQAQGWIEMRENVGSFVLPSIQKSVVASAAHVQRSISVENGRFNYKRSAFLDSPFESHDCELAFNDGQPDYRLPQLDELTRLYRNSTKRRQISRKLGDHQFASTDYLRLQLTNFLKISRGITLKPDQLLVARSKEMLLYIVAQILLQPKDTVLVGSLSYFSANMIFQQVGAKLQTIPVDAEGIDVNYIAKHFKKGDIRAVYVSPQNHYPTTVTLSAQRRAKLLILAEELDFLILEDDSDCEFYYEKKQPLSLIAEDVSGRVIYIGAFGKTFVPTFKTAFLVASVALVAETQKYLGILDRQGDVVMEQTLGELIEAGEMHRQLKKSLKIYKERRNKMLVLLDEHLGAYTQIAVPSGGLAIWIVFKKSFSLTQLAQNCLQASLFIPRMCLYQNKDLTALRLGFGHLSDQEMGEAIMRLSVEVRKLVHA